MTHNPYANQLWGPNVGWDHGAAQRYEEVVGRAWALELTTPAWDAWLKKHVPDPLEDQILLVFSASATKRWPYVRATEYSSFTVPGHELSGQPDDESARLFALDLLQYMYGRIALKRGWPAPPTGSLADRGEGEDRGARAP